MHDNLNDGPKMNNYYGTEGSNYDTKKDELENSGPIKGMFQTNEN